MTEAFLQYVWQHKLLRGPLVTTEGASVEVERPGELNRDAGPDFFDARIYIDGLLWAGNVEIHVRASDWKQHGHSQDKSYNNVVLHVVYICDTDVRLENGKNIPTIEIADAIPTEMWDNYDALINPKENSEIPCAPRLKEIPEFLFNASQERLVVERMERKSDNVRRLIKESKGNWEQACYWLTARYLGGKTNAFPFELLAKVTPLSIVAKIKDKPERVQALYMGQAGLLEGEFNDDYPKALKREYEYMRTAYNLTPMAGHLWKFFRLYPAGFPTLRISQLANLLSKSNNLFSKLLESSDVKALQRLFNIEASDYWDRHYNFDNESAFSRKQLGKDTVNSLLVNAWVPLLFEYGVQHDDQNRKDQAFGLLQQLPAESNRIVRLWAAAGIKAANAAQTQALIQRHTEYCSKKRCLDCQLAFRFIKTYKGKEQCHDADSCPKNDNC